MLKDLKGLDDYRKSLQLAQVGALLHNLGKIASHFFINIIDNNNLSAKNYEYQHILRLIEEDWKDNSKYLFSWDEIPGNDSLTLTDFLKKKFDVNWVKTAKIEKIDNDKTIKVSTGQKFILLKLNNEKTKLFIEINDVRTDEFIVKTENDNLKIYDFKIALNKHENHIFDKIIDSLKQEFNLPFPFNDRPYRPGDMIEYLGQGKIDKKDMYNKYLFCWEEIPGNDSERFIEILKWNNDIDWVRKEEIKKTDEGNSIRASFENNDISLNLNNDKTKVNLIINNAITDEFITNTENGKLKIYTDSIISDIFKKGSRLTHLMNRAHHGASGGEKDKFNSVLKKQTDIENIFKSTPFGWELRFNLKDVDLDKANIEIIIQKHLNFKEKSLDFEAFSQELLPCLEKNMADSNRPINDITVGDIGRSGMAFFLTQVIEKIVTDKSIDQIELSKLGKDNSLFWRVLSFRLDGLNYLEGAPSLADARVRLGLLHKALENIRDMLEGLPIAIEVYHDENGSFYIYPDLPKEHQITQDLMKFLDSELLVDGISLPFCLSSEKLVNHPKDEGGKYVGEFITEQINAEIPKVYDIKTYAESWESEGRELCVACGVRPQGYGPEYITTDTEKFKDFADKASRRKICCLCMERRRGVSEKWATESLNKNTVWIDEVSDIHGRVALIAGQFDMQDWNMLYPESFYQYFEVENIKDNTIPIKDEELYKCKYDDEKQIFVRYSQKEQNRTKYKEKFLVVNNIKIEIKNIERLNGKYKIILCEPHNIPISQKYTFKGANFISEDNRTIITVDEGDEKKVEDIYLHKGKYVITRSGHYYDIQKSQSFARIQRVWETTKHFWKDVADFSNIDKDGPRIEIRGDVSPKINADKPGSYHAYYLLLGKIKLSVVWDEKNNRFITAHNLKFLSQPNRLNKDVKAWLLEKKGERVSIEEPTGYGSENKDWGSIMIREISEIEDSKYIPAINILSEPRTFMGLVPANKALDIVNKIKEKYELEMGKVRNRLPLHLGIIFAPHKTPFRVILDAGRRILNSKPKSFEEWVLKKKESDKSLLPETLKNNPHFENFISLHLERNDKKAIWHVPLKMGDGNTDDRWYPYVFVPGNINGIKSNDRAFSFKYSQQCDINDGDNTRKAWFVHVSDLKEEDIILFTPSTLDFHWMDTSGSRFEIAYEENGQRMEKDHRPYLLDDLVKIQNIWKVLFRHLNSTQILAIHDLIEVKRSEWEYSEVFRKFCFNIIANVDWRTYQDKDSEKKYPWEISKKRKMEFLCEYTDYAATGLLSDVIELYLKILKEKPEREREEI